MRFILPIFVIATVLAISLGDDENKGCSEVKNLDMILRLRWNWTAELKNKNSAEFKRREDRLYEVMQNASDPYGNATDPVKVCNVTLRALYKSGYADARVRYDMESYIRNNMTEAKMKKKLKEYADTWEIRKELLSVSSVVSSGQVPKILGATFMCTVFEVLWQLL